MKKIVRLWRGKLPVLIALAGLAGSVVAADYGSAVLNDNPLAYYRFNDSLDRSGVHRNIGSLGAAGNSITDLGKVHSFPGAIVGDGNRAAFFDFASRTEIPWNAAFNPPNDRPFTLEVWFYPASDQTATGQSPLANRYAPSGAQRQGWVFFQRKPSEEYLGSEPVGWNFRMYNENGGSTALDITSRVPYQLGKWTHVVVVYQPNNVTDASLTMYIDGVEAATTTWAGEGPGYVANTNDHADAPSYLAIGNYNNTAGTSLNPYLGGVDEFAFYTNILSPAQILSHYQNATNANRATSYSALIQSHNPVLYLRLDEIPGGADVAVNMGDLRESGNATHSAEVRHPVTSALVGQPKDGAAGYHNRNGNAVTTIPWRAANNPNAGVPFTLELWLRPRRDQQGGQCPVNNRWVGGTGRTGWVIFQRNPNSSYPPAEGLGWNFRMFSGVGGGGQDVLTGVDYNIDEWSHLVVTWQPEQDNGDPGENGNNQWSGTLTAYFNGQMTDQQTRLYAANREETEDGTAPSDLAIGAYNAASGLGNNPFEGDVDEFAFYANYLLTPEQILEHYQTGTNSRPAVNYETLVLTAPFQGPEREGPKTYLRFNEAARYPAANSGRLGYLADGHLVGTTNNAAGPRPPTAGFDAANTAVPVTTVKQFVGLNNPAGLNITGPITLEAWIQPGAVQGEFARIISHGPATLSSFLNAAPDNATLGSSETYLAIRNGTHYVVGSTSVTNDISSGESVLQVTRNEAGAAISAGDLIGNVWVHLAGTYDGTRWRLYRNGTEIANIASSVGALASSHGDWAIGATGNGWGDPFNGTIDEVAIYDRALTAAQLQAHATGGGSSELRITSITAAAGSVTISWVGGSGPYLIQFKGDLMDAAWMNVGTTIANSITLPQVGGRGFFRVMSGATTTVQTFTATLTGAAEVPAVVTSGRGTGIFSIEGNTFSYDISFSGLTGNVTLAHIHGPASLTQSAGVLIPSGSSFTVPSPPANSGRIRGTATINDTVKNHILGGMTYANIHSSSAGGGEIRGQLIPLP